MLDLKFLRENPEVVKQNIQKKFQDRKLPLVDEVIELDAQARATQQEADELRAERNKISKQIGALMAQGKKQEAACLLSIRDLSKSLQMLQKGLSLTANFISYEEYLNKVMTILMYLLYPAERSFTKECFW